MQMANFGNPGNAATLAPFGRRRLNRMPQVEVVVKRDSVTKKRNFSRSGSGGK
jgi:hypothetical protein